MSKDLVISDNKTLGALLEQAKPELQKALPQHMTIERLLKVAITAANKIPKLLECSRSSFMKALMDSAIIGLEPDGINAHLIPYGKEE